LSKTQEITKIQGTRYKQAPKPNIQAPNNFLTVFCLDFGYCNLGFVCALYLGVCVFHIIFDITDISISRWKTPAFHIIEIVKLMHTSNLSIDSRLAKSNKVIEFLS